MKYLCRILTYGFHAFGINTFLDAQPFCGLEILEQRLKINKSIEELEYECKRKWVEELKNRKCFICKTTFNDAFSTY